MLLALVPLVVCGADERAIVHADAKALQRRTPILLSHTWTARSKKEEAHETHKYEFAVTSHMYSHIFSHVSTQWSLEEDAVAHVGDHRDARQADADVNERAQEQALAKIAQHLPRGPPR